MTALYVIAFLASIVIANITVATFGASVSILNAFFLIALDLTARDKLHDLWQANRIRNMGLLIVSGSVLSALLNASAAPIALASVLAFASATITDTIVYQWLAKRSAWVRMNGSNLFSAAVDSIVFPAVAFGFPLLIPVMLGQYVAKVAGGAFWSYVFTRGRNAAHD